MSRRPADLPAVSATYTSLARRTESVRGTLHCRDLYRAPGHGQLEHAVALLSTGTQSAELGFGTALLKMLLALLVVCALAYFLLRFGLGASFSAGGTGAA